MRIVAMVLGLIGALISALGVYRGWPGVQGEYLAWGIFSSLIGIAGGILALRRPGVGGILMLVSGIGGWSALIAVWIFEGLWCQVYGAPTICLAHLHFYNAYLNAGPPLFIGGALSFASCKEYQRGRIAAMVFGLIGGLTGICTVLRSPFFLGEYVVWGILSSLIGIAGGILALRRPGVAGILMLVSGIGGWSALIAAWIFEGLGHLWAHLPLFFEAYIIAGPPLFIGGGLSLAACKRYHQGSMAAMLLGLIGGLVGALAVDVSALYFGGVAPKIMALGLILPAIGIAGGALSLTRPAPGGTVMLVSGTSGIVASLLGWPHFAYDVAYMFASVPLITGAALSFTAPMEYPRCSRLVMALGIGAGLLGAFGAGPAFHFRCPVMIPWTILVFLMVIGGAMLALTRPKAAGALMLLSAIAGWLVPVGMLALAWGIRLELAWLYVAGLYFLAGLLLIAGGILSFLFSRKRGASGGPRPKGGASQWKDHY